MTTRISSLLLLFAAGVLVIGSLVLPGCTDFLDNRVRGDQTENQPPVVYFVNIPPDGYKVSVNPAVYWVGTDADGLVTMFRYIVVLSSDLNGMSPDEYAGAVLINLPESEWTYLDVTVDDPQTGNIIPASADLTDPVNNYIDQYIFVQAFDDQSATSNIAWRLISRNDYPPATRAYGVDTSNIYINAAVPGAVGTGTKVRWESTDPDDEDTLFEYKWDVYGPYDSLTLKSLKDSFLVDVFVSNDAKVYRIGNGDVIYIIDTSFTDTGIVVDTTETIYVDTITANNLYGELDELLRLEDEDFQNSNVYNLKVDSSWNGAGRWVTNVQDSLYDLYRNSVTDSTIVRRFLFVVTGRDGAQVADLTPAWTTFKSIEPMYERDILILDFANVSIRYNGPYIVPGDTAFDGSQALIAPWYWREAIENWAAASGLPIDFEILDTGIYQFTRGDYLYTQKVGVTLKQLLQHKMVILYNDDILQASLTDGTSPTYTGSAVYTAIDAGVNAFVTMRAPLSKGLWSVYDSLVTPDQQYRRYFGVQDMVWSGWGYNARGSLTDRNTIRRRVEDFIGAKSLPSAKPQFPDLMVDSNLLHLRYNWDSLQLRNYFKYSPFKWGGVIPGEDTLVGQPFGQYPIPSDLRALPEVDWASTIYGTEVLYLYQSYYGSSHPLGEPYNFHGAPVGHRLNSGYYKTVHFCFTPLSIDTVGMQQVLNEVFNWLYEPNLVQPPTKLRYRDAKVTLNMDEARENYWERIEDNMLDEDAKISYKEVGLWR
jgi:hypothetical protein